MWGNLYANKRTNPEQRALSRPKKIFKNRLITFQDCFILDSGSTTGVFAWIGRGASKDERVAALRAAEKFLERNGLPKWTRVSGGFFTQIRKKSLKKCYLTHVIP